MCTFLPFIPFRKCAFSLFCITKNGYLIEKADLNDGSLREVAKINSFCLNGRAIKVYPPPPFELHGRWNVGKKVKTNYIFSLLALPFTHPPPLNGPAFKRLP